MTPQHSAEEATRREALRQGAKTRAFMRAMREAEQDAEVATAEAVRAAHEERSRSEGGA